MPDIQGLTSTIEKLEKSFGFWNGLAIAFTLAAAIAATGYFVTSWIANRRSTRLKDAQAALIRAKDDQLARDLRDKDLQIAEANRKAKEAEEKAEQIRQQNFKLEERLAHRRISPAQHAEFVVALRPYAGSTVALTKLGDLEASTFADDIFSVLRDAGWNVNLTIVGAYSPPRYGLHCYVDERSAPGKSLAAVLRQLPTVNVESVQRPQFIADILVGLKAPP